MTGLTGRTFVALRQKPILGHTCRLVHDDGVWASYNDITSDSRISLVIKSGFSTRPGVDWTFELFGNLIGSQRCKLALEAVLADSVEWIEVTIAHEGRWKAKITNEPWYVIQCKQIVECADKSRSRWSESGDYPGMWIRFMMDSAFAHPTLKLFRVRGLESLVIAHVDVRRAARAAKLKGISFVNPDESEVFW